MTNEPEKSGPPKVAGKSANAGMGPSAERMERMGGAKGNTKRTGTHRALGRASVFPGLERVRERARTEKKARFTALLHHVNVAFLRAGFSWLKRDAAPVVDGLTGKLTAIFQGFSSRGAPLRRPSRP
jgi:hypothetical protein